jgi:polysaccharide biosynthesis/export protein VpsN
MRSFICFLLMGGVGLSVLTGCGTFQSGKTTLDGGYSEEHSPDILRPGDRIGIIFTDVSNPPRVPDQTIREDGMINLPFNKQIKAAGKTKGQLEHEIREQFVGPDKYFTRLTVNVNTEQRVYYVGGEVKSPGRQLYMGEVSVMQAIAAAGDFTNFARKQRIELTRGSSGEKLMVDGRKALRNAQFDPPVFPGDTVHVPRRFW